MKSYLSYLVCFFCALNSFAQVKVTGNVIHSVDKDAVVGASVIIKGSDGKIKKFATTKNDGSFALELPSIDGTTMEVTMMGFTKQSLPLEGAIFPLTVYLEPGTTILKEVTVKADRIREQGDTITYGVSAFAQEQDRSIGDVLKRMPGIDVAASGKITYQGEDINKFYIEGSDLLGGKYGIATNGIRHDDVGAVEVMENHQPMQVLSGISFSDKAAINLKLKNKAKATWTLHGNAGGGYSWQPEGALWDGELFAMAVMANFQNITTLKTNNKGEDLSVYSTDFFASARGTALKNYVSVGMPGVLGLKKTRTFFNRSAMLSTNNLWKMGRGEVKAQIDYSFNRVVADAINITTYFLNEGDRIITENRKGKEHSHSLSGKFIYELNQKTAFINNTLKTNLDWDNVELGVSGSLTNNQKASLPDYYVSNSFKLIKRFNGKHLVTFNSNNEWESLPQTLTVINANGNDKTKTLRQKVSDHAFYTHESAAYAFTLKGITVSLEGGIKGYFRTMNSSLPDMPEEIPGETENVINTNSLILYATPKFEYWVNRVNFTLNAPLSVAHYTFDKSLANRSEFYFSPSLSINWKPNNRLSIGLKGNSGRSPISLNMIQPDFIMTNYRSFRRGIDDFYNSTSQGLSANVSYKHTRRGLFANAMVVQSWSKNPYTMVQQLYGDYVVYSYSSANNNGKLFMTNGSVGKTIDFIRGSTNINGSYSRSESNLISENNIVNSVTTGWSVGGKINGTPIRWLSFDYSIYFSSSRLTMNSTKASWLGSMENDLLINIMPHKKWEWHINGEHYRNELTEGNYKNVLLLDTKLIYKMSKRIEFSASLSNIFNQRTYNYRTYSQISSFESQRWLRGREFLISIYIKK